MRRNSIANKIFCVFITLIFLLETGFDGGSLCDSKTIFAGGEDKLSPILMSPNNLGDSGKEIADLIKVGLLINLKSLVDGQDVEKIDYEKLKRVIIEHIENQDKKSVYNRPLNPELPWFFMNEGYEENGDIFVKGRLMHLGEEKTFYVQFSLEKDQYDGFVIKRVYAEEEGKIVLLFELGIAPGKRDIKLSAVKVSDEQMEKTGNDKKVIGEEAGQELSEKSKTPSTLKTIFNSIKKATLIVSIVLGVIFSSVTNNNAATGSSNGVDYQRLMSNYIDIVQLDEIRSLIEMANWTEGDLREYIALVMTESDGLSAKEELTDAEKDRMTSPVGAVGPLQLMKTTVENANDRLHEIEEIINQNKYMGVVNQGKLDIFEDLGFSDGIVWEKVDHNNPEYEEAYHFRVATLLFKLNEFDLKRLKLVKNKNSKGWHFNIRKGKETNGFDIGEALIRAHNIDIETLKNGMRQCGPDPSKYEKCLGEENPAFYKRYEAFLRVLQKKKFNEKVVDLFYEANGWERKENRRIEKYIPDMQAPALKDRLTDMFSELNKNGDINFLLFVSLFAGTIAVVSRYWKSQNDILEPDEWLLEYVFGSSDAGPENYTDESAEEYRTAKVIEYPPGYVPGNDMNTLAYNAEPLPIQEELSKASVTEMISRLNVEAPKEVKQVGMMLTPPVAKYTIYIPANFCPSEEYSEDRAKFGSRFNFYRTRKDTAGGIIRDVIEDVLLRGIDPKTVVVQLPKLSIEDYSKDIEKLNNAGIRFVTVDINGYKSMCKDTEEKEKYRECIYSIMLLVRKVSDGLDDPVFFDIFKTLFKRYTSPDVEGKDAMFQRYLEAIKSGNISELVKVILIYRPFEKLVDELGRQWDSKALVFA